MVATSYLRFVSFARLTRVSAPRKKAAISPLVLNRLFLGEDNFLDSRGCGLAESMDLRDKFNAWSILMCRKAIQQNWRLESR